MSALNNRHWIEHDGAPITGRTPPVLLVYGLKMTGDQEAQVRHIYKLFTDVCLVAVGDYQVRRRTLADGTKVRCTSFMGKDVVEVWTRAIEDSARFFGGFIARPQSGILGAVEYWGKPFTAETKPLGTLFGEDPQVFIQAKWSAKLNAATDELKVHRGMPSTYGAVDWKGATPDDGVLSWDAEDLGQAWCYLFDKPEGLTPSKVFFAHTGWMSSVVTTDAQKRKTIVRRYRSKGTGTKVYSGFQVVGEYVGAVVNGAAIYSVQLPSGGTKKMVVAALMEPDPYGSLLSETQFVTQIGGEQKIIGVFPSIAGGGTPLHGWYFNRSGDKARCTFVVSATHTAVYEVSLSGHDEATFELTHSKLADPGAASVATTYRNETQYESGYTYDKLREELSTLDGDEVDWPFDPPIPPNRWKTTKHTTEPTAITSGTRTSESTFLASDFVGEVGVVSFIRATAPSVSASGFSRVVSYGGVVGGSATGGVTEEIYAWTGEYQPEHLQLVSRNDLGSEISMSLYRWTNAPYSYSLGRMIDPVSFPSGNFERNAVLDFDLRADAFLVRTVRLNGVFFQDANVREKTGPLWYEDGRVGVFAVGEYSSGTQAVSVRVIKSGAEVFSRMIYSYSAPLGDMKSFPAESFALESSSTTNKISTLKRTLIEFLAELGDEPYLIGTAFGEQTIGESSSTRFVGALREYYSMLCGTFVSLNSADTTSREELFGGVITRAGGNNVFEVLQMAEKSRPVLYRLSVI